MVEDDEVSVWATIDRQTDEVIHIEVSRGRSTVDVLFVLRTVLERCRRARDRCRSWSLVQLDLDELDLDCEARCETWGDRSIVESWFSPFKCQLRRFFDRFPYHRSYRSVEWWAKAVAIIHNARC